jgi:drug/metabolite transporter (DMT)-like permease
MPATTRATLIGLTAVLMWSLLGLFAAGSGAVPPFLLNALCFGLSGTGAIVWLLASGRGLSALRQPAGVWIVGTLGLFGFHALYFTAMRIAPPVEANLINYLWPVLIVLFSALLPGERLRWFHLAGGLMALCGAALVVTGGSGLALRAEYLPGYLAALAAALLWAGYSVLSRRLPEVPTDAVTGFCLVTALLAIPFHLLLETAVWPQTSVQWLSVAALGLGPVGLAFYFWDIGVKRGDIQALAAASYAAPLLSTLLLIAAGFGRYNNTLALACLLITAGALLAASALLRGRPAS